MLVAHGDGVVGVEAHDASVLHEHAGHAVYRGGDDVFVIETDIVRVRLDEAVEVGSALRPQPKVPLAHGGCGIAFFLEEVGHGDAGGVDDEFRIARGNAGVLLPPRIHARQQSEARGRAGGGCGVCVGELHALSGQTVDVGRADFGSAIAAQVADAEVIGNQADHVRLLPGVVGGFAFGAASASGGQDYARN